MITLITCYLLLSLVVYLILFLFFKGINTKKRLLISIAIFLFLSISSTASLVWIGDRPSDDSIEINLNDLDKNTGVLKQGTEEKYRKGN